MIIRRALLSDARSIRDLAQELTIPRKSCVPNGLEGFVVPDVDGWKARIEGNKYFFVADTDRVSGFLACYTREHLRRFAAQDEVKRALLDDREVMAYLELLGVDRKYRRTGVANALEERLEEELYHDGFTHFHGIIAHAPLRNEASIRLHLKRGATLVRELSAYDGMVFGVYQKTIAAAKLRE